MSMRGRIQVALAALPERHYLQIHVETVDVETADEDAIAGSVLCALLFERPPEDGWKTKGAMYAHGPEFADFHDPVHPADVWEDAVRVSITAYPDDSRFWNLLVGMLERFVEQVTRP